MGKDISTLVADIYELLENGSESLNHEFLKDFSFDLTNLMGSRLIPRDGSRGGLRMSNIGRPDRQIWYDINGEHEAEKLRGSTLLKFAYGDVIEHMILYLAKQAGHAVEHQQLEVEVDGIKGHLDAVIDGVVVDVKSASSQSFKKFEDGSLFEKGNDPFGYTAQLSGYVTAYGGGRGAFLAVDKTLGKLALLPVSNEIIRSYNVERRIADVKAVVANPKPPRRCYLPKEDGKSGNLVLDTGCAYCGHKFHCWSDANDGAGLRTFIYSSGPRYFVDVAREPNVAEVGAF